MDRKLIIQLFLFSIIILISVSVFLFFFNKKEKKKTIQLPDNSEKLASIDKNQSNLISNIEYFSKDSTGNEYAIKAALGEINPMNSDLILMSKVNAIITLSNSEIINIKANTAIYNKFNFETNFSDNVLLNYSSHEILSDNLDLYLEKNIVSISNNIIYNYPGTILKTDKIEIDLTTKNTKIFMLDSSKKISIKSKKKNGNN